MSIIDELIKYSRLEESYARELGLLAERLHHPVLKAIFAGIAKDSEKHSVFYRAIADALSRAQPFIKEEELKEISEVIEKHIETEAKMLEEARQLLQSTSDPRAKLLLAAIVEDEAKHHALLVSVKKRIAEPEAFTEETMWDMVWKESPWHGTPGG